MRHHHLVCALALLAPSAPAVIVTNTSELIAAINAANSGGDRTILLQDGTYLVPTTLVITAANVTIRSVRGDRNAASIFGPGMNGSVRVLLLVQGSGFTVRDLTLGRCNAHAVQVQGELGVSDVLLGNLRIQDTFEQMVKVSYDAQSTNRSQRGILENSLLEYTAGIGPQFYIGGIDAHFCRDWIVRGNTFKNISSPSGSMAEHAVHFWSGSEGTQVTSNRIVDCDRGIGFGLGTRGHVGGSIRNNMVWHGSATTPFADVGIGLENASNVEVANNTVLLARYQNAIEYRFTGTAGGRIVNNLCNRAIAARDGGTAALQSNLTNAANSWFALPAQGDLHLASAVSQVVDGGVAVAGLLSDYDGEPRPLGAAFDLGADEWVTSAASFTLYGTGCAGSAGEPGLRALRLAWLGHSGELEVFNLAPSQGVILCSGFSRTAAGSLPLPHALQQYGMPGCSLLASPDVNVFLPVQGGLARWTFGVPAPPALLGASAFHQAFSLEPGANALGAINSRGGESRIGG